MLCLPAWPLCCSCLPAPGTLPACWAPVLDLLDCTQAPRHSLPIWPLCCNCLPAPVGLLALLALCCSCLTGRHWLKNWCVVPNCPCGNTACCDCGSQRYVSKKHFLPILLVCSCLEIYIGCCCALDVIWISVLSDVYFCYCGTFYTTPLHLGGVHCPIWVVGSVCGLCGLCFAFLMSWCMASGGWHLNGTIH